MGSFFVVLTSDINNAIINIWKKDTKLKDLFVETFFFFIFLFGSKYEKGKVGYFEGHFFFLF